MSLILDALKRSETERKENTATDNLAEYTTQPSPTGSLVPWMVAAILLLNLAAITWLLVEKPWQQMSPMTTAPVNVEPALPHASLVEPAAPETAPHSPTRPARSLAEEQLPQSVPHQTQNKTPARSLEQQQNQSTTSTAQTAQQVTPAATAPAKAALNNDINTDVLRLIDTPSAIRSQLKALEINAHVYSDNRQKRFVLINLEKYREGDQLGEFVLEQILANGLVINYGEGRALLPLGQQR